MQQHVQISTFSPGEIISAHDIQLYIATYFYPQSYMWLSIRNIHAPTAYGPEERTPGIY